MSIQICVVLLCLTVRHITAFAPVRLFPRLVFNTHVTDSQVRYCQQKANILIVNNIPFSLSENKVKEELFSKLGMDFGSDIEFKLKSLNNRVRMGYLVHSPSINASQIVEKLDNTDMDGRQLRISVPNNQTMSLITDESMKVIVRNIDTDISNDVFYQNIVNSFEDGVVRAAHVVLDSEFRSKGFGFICFNSEEDATRALNVLENLQFNGKPINVEICKTQFTVCIGNLPSSITSESLTSILKSEVDSESIVSVKVIYDKVTNEPLEHAYIQVTSQEMCQEIISKFTGKVVEGKTLNVVDCNQPKDDGYSLYIGNLPWKCDDSSINNLISDVVGPNLVDKIWVASDKTTGKPSGFCFVDFKDKESMDLALSKLSRVEMFGRTLRVNPRYKKR